MDNSKHVEKVDALFTSIAARYNLINDIQSLGLHRFWKQRIVEMSSLANGECALDICCGTGDLVTRLANKNNQVIGLDMNSPMLKVAHNQLKKSNINNASLFQADALNLPFNDSSFDVVTISYGLRNLSNYQNGLSEISRVLKANGRLLILDFGKPPNRFIRNLYYVYLKLVLPVFGLFFCGEPAAYSYILKSLQKYPAQEGVSSILSEIGFSNISVTNIMFGSMSIHVAENTIYNK